MDPSYAGTTPGWSADGATAQRVLDLFRERGSGCYLSAEEVRNSSPTKLKVSLATVYRTCVCQPTGFLQELELTESGHRFELAVAITGTTTIVCVHWPLEEFQ